MVIGDYTVDQVIEKAQTLIEAMPYIKKFQGKTVVVKYGGSAMLDENLKYNVIKDVAMLKLVGMKPVIVHGGGNKSLVSLMQKIGLKAVGISGKDGGMFTVKKKFPGGKDIGYVGEITNVDTSILTSLIEDDFIPVIAPIGVDENYEDYNINADDAACAVATALEAEKLVFLTDIEGVFIDPTDKSTLISEMDIHEAKDIIEKGVVGGGMLPKLNNCIAAMENGVSRVHILDGRLQHCLLLEFFTQKGIGTAILKEPLF